MCGNISALFTRPSLYCHRLTLGLYNFVDVSSFDIQKKITFSLVVIISIELFIRAFDGYCNRAMCCQHRRSQNCIEFVLSQTLVLAPLPILNITNALPVAEIWHVHMFGYFILLMSFVQNVDVATGRQAYFELLYSLIRMVIRLFFLV